MMGLYSGGMGQLAGLAMFVFWLAVLGLIIWALGRVLPDSTGETTRAMSAKSESAVEILDSRLANGDVDLHDWQPERSALSWLPEQESAPATPSAE